MASLILFYFRWLHVLFEVKSAIRPRPLLRAFLPIGKQLNRANGRRRLTDPAKFVHNKRPGREQ